MEVFECTAFGREWRGKKENKINRAICSTNSFHSEIFLQQIMDFEYQQHCTIQPPTSRLLSTDLAIIPSPCQSAPAAGPSLGREAAAVLAVEHKSGEHFVPLCPIHSGQTPPPCCRRSPRAAPALLLPIHPLRSPEGAAGNNLLE